MEPCTSSGKIGALIGMVASLDAKLNKLVKSSGSASLPVVDFIVDAFDRPDNSVISTYWPAGSGAVLSRNRVVYTGAAVQTTPGRQPPSYYVGFSVCDVVYKDNANGVYPPASAVRAYPGSSYDYLGIGLIGGTAPTAPLFYSAILSGPCIVEIDFELPPPGAVFYSAASQLTVTPSYPTAGGVCVGDATGINDVSARVFAGTSIGLAGYADGVYGNWALGPSNVAAVAFTGVGSLFTLMATGKNTLRLTPTGSNAFAISLNGVVLNMTTVYGAPTAVRAGLSIIQLLVTSVCSKNMVPIYGITSFRAWNSTYPVPPLNQSGHGIYISTGSVQYQYTDKYHTPMVDGNNTLTGYHYDPLAP
jgi:hypothetical protein